MFFPPSVLLLSSLTYYIVERASSGEVMINSKMRNMKKVLSFNWQKNNIRTGPKEAGRKQDLGVERKDKRISRDKSIQESLS